VRPMVRLRRAIVGEGPLLAEPPEPPFLATEDDPPIVAERSTVVGQLLAVKLVVVGGHLDVVSNLLLL